MRGNVFGPYEILAEVGSGATGRVYRARVTEATAGLEKGTVVALKVIHGHLGGADGFFRRLLREADIGHSVRHPNVVQTYLADVQLHEEAQQNYIVMEYVDGVTLRELLREVKQIPEELCRHIGCEVARGLEAIHEAGVVHRDLKPENVLITRSNAIKIMDLGLAQIQDEAQRLSQTGSFVGSPMYAAPEQFHSGERLDGRTDLYALGAVLFELATGRHVCAQRSVAAVIRQILEVTPPRVGQLNPQLSVFFEEVVHTLLAKPREHRFDSAAALRHVLATGESSPWWQERAQVIQQAMQRPLRRARIPRETPLHGRTPELGLLGQAFERARSGHGQVVLLEGEAGVGKSRLVDEFVAQRIARGEDINYLFGAYPPGGAATAEGALSTAYREHFGSHGMEHSLRRYLAKTPLLIPAFAAVLRGDPPPADQEHLTKASLQAVFAHATRALASERPTILLVDDLHFAPPRGPGTVRGTRPVRRGAPCPAHRCDPVGRTSRLGLRAQTR